jgi:hypothetical protein
MLRGIEPRTAAESNRNEKKSEKKRGAALCYCASSAIEDAKLLGRTFALVLIMVAIIPIAVGVPAVTVLIPPATVAGITVLACFVQLTAGVVGLTAFASVMLDGFVETMVRPRNALLAIIIGAQTRRPGEEQKSRKCSTGQRDLCRSENSRLKFTLHPVPSSILK